MNKPPDISEMLSDAIERRLMDVHTFLPGVIEKYTDSTQMCDVQPALSRMLVSGTVVALPLITEVPVAWPRVLGGFLHMPLKKGDAVTIIFSERSLDKWKQKGGVVDPADRRKFDLSDAVVYPGLYPKSNPIPPAKLRAGMTQLMQGDDEIAIGGGKVLFKSARVDLWNADTPAQPMVLGTVLVSALTAVIAKIDGILDQMISGNFMLTTTPGNPTVPNPSTLAAVTAIKTTLATAKTTYLDTAATNIISQTAFTDR